MSSKMKVYPPLRLIKKMEVALQRFEEAKELMECKRFSDILADELAFALKKLEGVLEYEQGIDPASERGELAKASVTSMIYDGVFSSIILSEWRKNKQVYHFPKEFYQMLIEMDDFDIEMSIFNYLPYHTFYLEIEDHKYMDGVFIRFSPETQELIFCILFKETCDFTESGVNGGFLEPDNKGSFKNFFERELSNIKASADDEAIITIREALIFMLQASMYLCAKNNDVVENPTQKGIYRVGTQVRDRYAEVRKWDVGTHVVREHKRMGSVSSSTSGRNEEEKERKRPRQHWRKAHWHKYKVGPGRTETILHFIAPTLINSNGDEGPVVIHKDN